MNNQSALEKKIDRMINSPQINKINILNLYSQYKVIERNNLITTSQMNEIKGYFLNITSNPILESILINDLVTKISTATGENYTIQEIQELVNMLIKENIFIRDNNNIKLNVNDYPAPNYISSTKFKNNIREKIIDWLYKIKINRISYDATQSITDFEVETNEKELKSNLIKNVIYLPASNNLKIELTQDYFIVNYSHVFPISLYSLFIDELETSLIEKAFANGRMYLTHSSASFYDNQKRLYKFLLNDTHLLGLKNTKDLYSELKQPGAISLVNSQLAKVTSLTKPNLSNIPSWLERHISNLKYGPKIYLELNKIDSLLNDIITSKNLIDVDTITSTTEEWKIKASIFHLNTYQERLSKIMTNGDEKTQLELILYGMIKNNNGIIDSNIINETNIESILNDKPYMFNQRFIEEYKKDPSKYIIKLTEIAETENRQKGIQEKYQKAEQIQEYLSYYFQALTKKIFSEMLQNDSSKLSYYFNDTNTYDSQKLDLFSLAELIIKAETFEQKDKIITTTPRTTSDYNCRNLFKVCDKLTYLENFNYIVNVERIFVTNFGEHSIDNDEVKSTANADRVYEIGVFDEILTAFFENNDTTKNAFYSIQNIDKLTSITSVSPFETKMLEISEEHTTFFGFSTKKNTNIITQQHTAYKEKGNSVNDVLNDLKESSVELRFATSLQVKRKTQDTPNSEPSDKTLDRIDELYLNLVGCFNTLKWLDRLNLTDQKPTYSFKEFIGDKTPVTDDDIKNFSEIKTILINKVYKDILIIYKTLLKMELFLGTENSKIKRIKEQLASLGYVDKSESNPKCLQHELFKSDDKNLTLLSPEVEPFIEKYTPTVTKRVINKGYPLHIYKQLLLRSNDPVLTDQVKKIIIDILKNEKNNGYTELTRFKEFKPFITEHEIHKFIKETIAKNIRIREIILPIFNKSARLAEDVALISAYMENSYTMVPPKFTYTEEQFKKCQEQINIIKNLYIENLKTTYGDETNYYSEEEIKDGHQYLIQELNKMFGNYLMPFIVKGDNFILIDTEKKTLENTKKQLEFETNIENKVLSFYNYRLDERRKTKYEKMIYYIITEVKNEYGRINYIRKNDIDQMELLPPISDSIKRHVINPFCGKSLRELDESIMRLRLSNNSEVGASINNLNLWRLDGTIIQKEISIMINQSLKEVLLFLGLLKSEIPEYQIDYDDYFNKYQEELKRIVASHYLKYEDIISEKNYERIENSFGPKH